MNPHPYILYFNTRVWLFARLYQPPVGSWGPYMAPETTGTLLDYIAPTGLIRSSQGYVVNGC